MPALVAREAAGRDRRVVREEQPPVARRQVVEQRRLLVDQLLGEAVVAHRDRAPHPRHARDQVGAVDDAALAADLREHPEHHASSNILGFDPALDVPVQWREDAPAGLQPETTFPRGPVLFFGSLFLFAWNTAIHSSQGLWSKIRMNRLIFCIGWAIRTAILLKLVGPVAMIASYAPAFAWVGLSATAHHFDQEVMLMEEFHDSKMSFVELQLRSLMGYHANEGLGKMIPMIALDHIYHHMLPTIADSHIPQSIKDEIDLIIKQELGVVPVQRSIWTGLLDAYKQHFGLTSEQASPKGFALASKDEGKGRDLFKRVARSNNDMDKTTIFETDERKVLVANVSGDTPVIVEKKEEEEMQHVISVDKSIDKFVVPTAIKEGNKRRSIAHLCLQTKPKLVSRIASAA